MTDMTAQILEQVGLRLHDAGVRPEHPTKLGRLAEALNHLVAQDAPEGEVVETLQAL